MKSSNKFITVILLTWYKVGLSHAIRGILDEHPPSLAIARPFSISDADQLPESFEVWKDFPPCRKGSSVKLDLFLVYSQSLEYAIQAQASIRAVEAMIDEGEEWSSCISQVFGIGIDIEPTEDMYRLDLQKSNPLWVNGPNRQFERTVRALQLSEFAAYDLMYYMEMDSVPVAPYWLDALMDGIHNQESEFAILGSKYQGYKWEAFISELPRALVNHINGNAFYNLTHPLLEAIVQQLEDEAKTAANSIPYDYRIAQMIDEVQTGQVPQFFAWAGNDRTLPKELIDFMSSFELEQLIRESRLMGNYATTNMLPSLIGDDEVVIHGARMFAPWDNSKLGEISLVISDWIPVASQAMLSSLDSSKHPFTEAIVVTPDDAQHDHLFASSVPVYFVPRGTKPDTADLCSVDIATPWFVMSNSFFQLKGDVEIMTHMDQKPVISFEEPSHESCFSDEACTRDFALAQELVPEFNAVYDEFDFVVHTETRNEYCQFLQAMNNVTWGNFPSVTSYVAYLQRTGQLEKLYVTSDRTMYGSRHMFVAREKSTLDAARPLPTAQGRKLRVLKRCRNARDTYACPTKSKKVGAGGGGGIVVGGGGGGGRGGGRGGGGVIVVGGGTKGGGLQRKSVKRRQLL